jgi:hypothetical protein
MSIRIRGEQMSWVDTVVVGIVIIIAIGIFYRALKEPIDHVLYWVKAGIVGAIDGLRNSGGSAGNVTQTITYG